jgi:hypothetical protein
MFGLGKLIGGVVGGVLEKVGLGKIAPFVQMGLNAMTGNWMGVAQDVMGLVSNFKGNPQDKASKQPPLGGFGSTPFSAENSPLKGNKMGGLLDGLKNLFGGILGGKDGGGLDKIFDAFKLFSDIFGDNQLFNNRNANAQANIAG